MECIIELQNRVMDLRHRLEKVEELIEILQNHIILIPKKNNEVKANSSQH